MPMTDKTLAFIGGGNMATSLIGGLVSHGIPGENIRVVDPHEEKRTFLNNEYGVLTTDDNSQAVSDADVVIFAVKPQILQSVAKAIAMVPNKTDTLFISVAAGVRETDLSRWLGGNVALVRTMPNTPALVKSGATALYANQLVTTEQKELAESILRAVGLTLWVEQESQMDGVTALSGSGPAYLFLVMEALEEAGIELGLSTEQARLLSLETTYGAAKMALGSKESPAVLRERVTSPGGTTEQALKVLEERQLRNIFVQALTAARDRSIELGEQLGSD